ncbi:hypothetical protein GS597_10255 [Synechococcales cyanobacterium C]|uniref:Uncharacterized protein n=1 Tax=Petrachloros mirabilis ULC683 TaxID=2781853 RepID=A0A8K1ZZB4_9CYAN|nr:hypothetical protein [Petrachloros mirabilis]NCJ06882.1 hypothetical protein [Petrachloros mirabilis ULC683]
MDARYRLGARMLLVMITALVLQGVNLNPPVSEQILTPQTLTSLNTH